MFHFFPHTKRGGLITTSLLLLKQHIIVLRAPLKEEMSYIEEPIEELDIRTEEGDEIEGLDVCTEEGDEIEDDCEMEELETSQSLSGFGDDKDGCLLSPPKIESSDELSSSSGTTTTTSTSLTGMKRKESGDLILEREGQSSHITQIEARVNKLLRYGLRTSDRQISNIRAFRLHCNIWSSGWSSYQNFDGPMFDLIGKLETNLSLAISKECRSILYITNLCEEKAFLVARHIPGEVHRLITTNYIGNRFLFLQRYVKYPPFKRIKRFS